MSQSDLKCPKCTGDLERGYVLDMSTHVCFAAQWAPGLPKRSWSDFWRQLMISLPQMNDRIPIATFRCKACGFLESYAQDEYRPK